VRTAAAHASCRANIASATASSSAPILAKRATSTAAAQTRIATKPEQILDREVAAGQTCHCCAEPRQRSSRIGQFLAEGRGQERLAAEGEDEQGGHATEADQAKRADQDRTRIDSHPGSSRDFRHQVQAESHRDPDDRLGRHRRDRVGAGRVARRLVLDHDDVHLLEGEEERETHNGNARLNEQTAKPAQARVHRPLR
jgi:hypothetical protein